MKNKFILILITILMLWPFILIAQISYQATFNPPVFKYIKDSPDSTEFTSIQMKKLNSISEIGKPKLPFQVVHFLLPLGTEADKVIINNVSKETIELINPLIPAQSEIMETFELKKIEREFINLDTSLFSANIQYPGYLAKIIRQDYFDTDKPIVTVAIYPIQYNYKANKIDFYSTINLTVTYKNKKQNNTLKKPKRNFAIEKHYLDLLEGIVENDNDINKFINHKVTTKDNQNLLTDENFVMKSQMIIDDVTNFNREYVIITSEELAPCFTEFIVWKRRKGVDIGLVTVDDIYNNYTGDLISNLYDNPGKIRQFLSDAYSNGLVYVLLGGKIPDVPFRYGCGRNDTWHYVSTTNNQLKIPADLYFSSLDGNWNVDEQDDLQGDVPDIYTGERDDDSVNYLSEIFVGRLLCETCEDVERWTRKVLVYEQNPGKGDNSYLTKCFMTQADNALSYDHATEIAQHLIDFDTTIWEEEPSWNSPEIPTFPTGTQVINEINNHYGLISLFGHGGPPGIAVGTLGKGTHQNHDSKYNVHSQDSWDENDQLSYSAIQEESNGIDNLTNYDHPSIICVNACFTTPYDLDFIRPDVTINLGMAWTTHCKGGGPAYMGNTRLAYTNQTYRLFREFADIISNGTTYHLGEAMAISKFQSVSDTKHHNNLTHNLIGCPEMEIWTDVPSSLPSVSISEIGNNVEVDIAGNFMGIITIMSVLDNGESFFETSNNLESEHYFTNVTRPYYVTVTRHNYLPFLKNPESIYIQDETIIYDKCISAENIYVGDHVTTSKPNGSVLFSDDCYVVLDAENEIILDTDIEIELGSTLIFK